MVITAQERMRGSLYRLELDGEPAGTVDKRTFDEAGYRLGGEITQEAWEELQERSARNRAKEKALYLLSQRDRPRGELLKKLQPEAGEEIAQETVDRLEEMGLLDDDALALRWAGDLSRRKCYPRRRVEQELTARGFDRDTARRAAEELETEDHTLALALLHKKYYNKMTTEDGRRKTAAALARYGFSSQAVRYALEHWETED